VKVILLIATLWPLMLSAGTWKVATLLPDGTKSAQVLKELGQEIEKQTAGQWKIKFFFGGSQGDEGDVLRKIRIGQLQGGVFTGRTLGEINGDIRVMELPFNFKHDRTKGLKALNNLSSFLAQGCNKNKMHSFGFFELGPIYLGLTKKATSISELHGIKLWSWEGDQLVASIIKTMGFVSVPLPLPDVLTALSTGMVEAAYAPPLGMVALQWSSKIKYLADYPLSYSVGSFLLDLKEWEKIPAADKIKIEKISQEKINDITAANISENQEALSTIKAMGVEFVPFPDSDVLIGEEVRKKTIENLRGKIFSEKALELLQKEL